MAQISYRVSQDVRIECVNGGIRFSAASGTSHQTPACSDALQRDLLALRTGIDEQSLASVADPVAAATFFYALDRLSARGQLDHVWHDGDRVAIVFQPQSADFAPREQALPTAVRLHRHCHLRRYEGVWALHRPFNPCVALLAGGEELDRLVAVDTGEADPETAAWRQILWRYGFLDSDTVSSLQDQCWEFHDAVFHNASRGGGAASPLGGTYRFKDRFPPPPAIKPAMSEDFVALADYQGPNRASGSLEQVMTRRHTSRRQDDNRPVTREQLREFLQRVARITERRDVAGQELLARPYPAGGAIHELEYYLAVRLCRDLEAGIYHYHSWQQRLHRLGDGAAAAPFIHHGAASWGNPDSLPQVVVIISSRIPRLAWKYQGLAYRLTLLNTGVALQTMYLVATDMALACAALGGGDARAFAAATGLDPLDEPSIAEFALGSPLEQR